MRGAVVVTGATGFLGAALCAALARRGRPVLAIGRNAGKLAALASPATATMRLDLGDAAPAALAIRLEGAGAVIHAAALSSAWGAPAAFEHANVAATRNLLEAARLAGIGTFVFVSSPTVYFRFADQRGIAETAPLPAPVNAYAATKRQAERLVAEAPIPWRIILRPRGIYGRGDTALLPRLLRAAAAGPLPLLRDGVAETDITHVDDVVAAILSALDHAGTEGCETFNISGGQPLRLTAIVDAACAANGMTPRWRRMPARLVIGAARLIEKVHAILPGRPEPRLTAYAAGLLAYSQTLDISKARATLGWAPDVDFAEGLRRTFGPPR